MDHNELLAPIALIIASLMWYLSGITFAESAPVWLKKTMWAVGFAFLLTGAVLALVYGTP